MGDRAAMLPEESAGPDAPETLRELSEGLFRRFLGIQVQAFHALVPDELVLRDENAQGEGRAREDGSHCWVEREFACVRVKHGVAFLVLLDVIFDVVILHWCRRESASLSFNARAWAMASPSPKGQPAALMLTNKHIGRLVDIEPDPDRVGVVRLHVHGLSHYLYYGMSRGLFYQREEAYRQLIRNETLIEWTYNPHTLRLLDPIVFVSRPRPPPSQGPDCAIL